MKRTIKNGGFTLVEILVVVVILAVLMSVAVPLLSDAVKSMRLTSAVNHVFSSLILTRSEAIKRTSRAAMCKSDTGSSCATAGGWEQGWIVFHDANGNGLLDAEESIIHRQSPLGGNLKISGNSPVANYVSFTPMGTSRYTYGAFQAGTITVCNVSGAKAEARQLVLHSSGRPRIAKVTLDSC
jgi:type IV fimbrial biogenesis protein FimT